MKRVVVAIGTRPDVIKMRPVIDEIHTRPELALSVWWSGQGKDIQDGAYMPVACDFGNVNWDESSLASKITATMASFTAYLAQFDKKIDIVLVHGDDGTAFACGLAAFLSGIPVGHVEAGLRTYSWNPWPEEQFRRMLSSIATINFAPDNTSMQCLVAEFVPGSVYVTGNTIVDVLPKGNIRVLVTLHRKENQGEPIQEALQELAAFQKSNPNAEITVIRHPNWGDRYDLYDLNVVEPLPREAFLEEIQKSTVVLTDSGGLQEECAWFKVPCLVMRDVTERTALLDIDAVMLIQPNEICNRLNNIAKFNKDGYPYAGRGTPSIDIVNELVI